MQTILVVEDDKHINEIVTEYLNDSGYAVLSVHDGEEAQEIILRGDSVDLFILDIMLPKIIGLSLLKILRNKQQYKDVPVIMLTAIQDEKTELLSFAEKANDYVAKPFSPKELVKKVQILLRGEFE